MKMIMDKLIEQNPTQEHEKYKKDLGLSRYDFLFIPLLKKFFFFSNIGTIEG